jgi:hypothetical protein
MNVLVLTLYVPENMLQETYGVVAGRVRQDELTAERPRIRDKILENDRYIDGKSIYWRLTVCRMTRYKRVKCRNRGKVSKVRDLFPLPFGNTGDAEPAFSDTLLTS